MKETMRIMTLCICALLGLASLISCGASGTSTPAADTPADTATTRAANFDADTAFAYIEKQCGFGPRVPNTPAHKACAQWIEQRLRATCDTAIVQRATVTTFDNTQLNIQNLIGSVNPQAERRILLLAHYDCRPWADEDPDPGKRQQAVMGANDAASGVAVLLELARQMSLNRPDIGVDLLFVDAEDWGEEGNDDSWALGTQYWAEHPHVAGYRPMFGILLDMVGARGAQFAPEYFSKQYAPSFVSLVWDTAKRLGFQSFFRDNGSGAVTDDHIVVNQRANIPCLDIIDMRPGVTESGFFPQWHTTGDTLEQIDRATLHAVGQTVSHLIYNLNN